MLCLSRFLSKPITTITTATAWLWFILCSVLLFSFCFFMPCLFLVCSFFLRKVFFIRFPFLVSLCSSRPTCDEGFCTNDHFDFRFSLQLTFSFFSFHFLCTPGFLMFVNFAMLVCTIMLLWVCAIVVSFLLLFHCWTTAWLYVTNFLSVSHGASSW